MALDHIGQRRRGWIIVSILFAWYAENFSSFNKTYGSLGVIAFMLWIWLSTIVVLIGAELNAETEHKRSATRPRGDQSPSGLAAREWRIPPGRRKSDWLAGRSARPATAGGRNARRLKAQLRLCAQVPPGRQDVWSGEARLGLRLCRAFTRMCCSSRGFPTSAHW
jgi:Virulence factor BrkB